MEYFVSYFDYYQPEAYIPRTDTFIEKDSSINEEIERMRLSTMSSVLTRRDVIVVASVSCIYGIGSRRITRRWCSRSSPAWTISRNQLLSRLVDLQYSRNDVAFERGQFRVRGDVVELRPSWTEDGLRIEFFGEEIERLSRFEPLTGRTDGNAAVGGHFPGQTIRHAAIEDQATPSWPFAGKWANASPGSRRAGNCSKRNKSRCGRNTIWK